jgi:hypothetical protein
MMTIPLSWRTGASRDDWINNVGSPIIFIRIQRVGGGYIRLATKGTFFAEEGGVPRLYNGDYLKDITNIDQALNFMQGKVGASNQMNNLSVVINNAYIDGMNFTTEYPLEQMLNATVEVYICFDEVELSIENSLQIYNGRIDNYVLNNITATLMVVEYSLLKQKRVPLRLRDFYNKFGQSWSVPDTHNNKIVPFNFGTGVFKVLQCHKYSEDREAKVIMGYPISPWKSFNSKLYYWNNTTRQLTEIDTDRYFENYVDTGALPESRSMDIDDIGLFPIESKQRVFVTPTSVTKYLYDTNEDLEKMINKKLDNNYYQIAVANNAPYSRVRWQFLSGSYQTVWRVRFNKKDFPGSFPFNMYVICDLIYIDRVGGSIGVKVRTQIYPYNINGGVVQIINNSSDWTQLSVPPTIDDGDYYYCYNIPKDYAKGFYTKSDGSINDSNYPRNKTEFEHRIKNDMILNDLQADEIYFDFNIKQDGTGNSSSWLGNFQVGLLLIPMTMPIDYYVDGTFKDYDTIKTAVDMIFKYGLGLTPASNYVEYINFARDYEIDGQVNEETDTYSLLKQFAEELGVFFIEKLDGVARFVDLNGKSADYNVTDQDIIQDENGALQFSYTKSSSEIYSEIYLDYDWNVVTQKFDKQRYLTPDNNNLITIDATPLTELARIARDNYNSNKKLAIQAKFIKNIYVAEELIEKAVRLYTQKPDLIKFISTFRLLDLQIGDQVTFNCADFSSTSNFIITRKRINKTNYRIEFELIESPFGTVGYDTQNKAIKEVVGINEYACISRGVAVKETVGLTEYIGTRKWTP